MSTMHHPAHRGKTARDALAAGGASEPVIRRALPDDAASVAAVLNSVILEEEYTALDTDVRAATRRVRRPSVSEDRAPAAVTALVLLAMAACMGAASTTFAQPTPFDRLPPAQLDATPPSGRVRGGPGNMTIHRTPCRNLPMTDVRRRIVDLAVQEWGFFGFPILDRTNTGADRTAQRTRRRRRRLGPAESARVAGSIAGYWAVTPQGGWIVDAQNAVWKGSRGVAARWRYPWSAAFVSWVMCEGGLGDASRFLRAVAHHVYIDQAIRARAADRTPAGYAAHDIGTTTIVPGDLLCSGRRPAYRSIAERRRQMGNGARTHCDIVVKLDPARGRILAIGGNVRGAVALKILPAAAAPGEDLHPVSGGGRPLFAHLKLRAAAIEANALDHAPTMRAVRCADGYRGRAGLAAAHLVPTGSHATQC